MQKNVGDPDLRSQDDDVHQFAQEEGIGVLVKFVVNMFHIMIKQLNKLVTVVLNLSAWKNSLRLYQLYYFIIYLCVH